MNEIKIRADNEKADLDLYIDEVAAQKFSEFLGSNSLVLAASAAAHNANNNNAA